MALHARLWNARDGRIGLVSDYDADFVLDFKEAIPARDRRWSKPERAWYFAAEHWPTVRVLLKDYDYEFTYEQERTQEPPRTQPAPPPPDPYSLLLRAAPDEALKKVYRLITTYVHPDKGGSTEAMKTVNVAWEKIARERGL